MLLNDELVLVECFLDFTVRHLTVLHLQFELILECVDLLGQNSAHTLLPLINVCVTNRVNQQLLELRELARAVCADLLGHLLIVVLQLAYLLKFTYVQVNLLLVLLFKHLLLHLDAMDDGFTTLTHGRFYFESQLLTLLL